MMTERGDIVVDFAFLQLDKRIGAGATSEVYCGRLKLDPVAVKVSTPPEITVEVIDVVVAEARISAKLKHKNIVNFKGLCIRPPQIAMVMELCEGGNLK